MNHFSNKIEFLFTDVATKDTLAPRFKLKLVHGVAIAFADAANEGFYEADGAWTKTPGLWVGVSWADCVPILFSKRDGSAVGAVHAGWKGTFGEIAVRFCESLKSSGESLSDWQALIGPSIRSCCYEVGADLHGQFAAKFPSVFSKVASTWNDTKIDLAEINRAQLLAAGMQNVEIDAPCTHCSKKDSGEYRFFSYRRDKTPLRQWALIRVKA